MRKQRKNIMRLLILILGLITLGCGSTKDPAVIAAQKKVLDDLVAQKLFQVEVQWAYPLATASFSSVANSGLLPPGSNVSAISLIDNSSYFRMQGDSISMYLPFFGERRMAGNYGTRDVSIQYNGKPGTIEITENTSKQLYDLKFSVKAATESYNVYVRITRGLVANITVNSSHRTSMRYQGNVSKLIENTEDGVVLQ